MARIKMGKRTLVETLKSIMTDPEATIEQKLEACKILASLDKPDKKSAKPAKQQKLKTGTQFLK